MFLYNGEKNINQKINDLMNIIHNLKIYDYDIDFYNYNKKLYLSHSELCLLYDEYFVLIYPFVTTVLSYNLNNDNMIGIQHQFEQIIWIHSTAFTNHKTTYLCKELINIVYEY